MKRVWLHSILQKLLGISDFSKILTWDPADNDEEWAGKIEKEGKEVSRPTFMWWNITFGIWSCPFESIYPFSLQTQEAKHQVQTKIMFNRTTQGSGGKSAECIIEEELALLYYNTAGAKMRKIKHNNMRLPKKYASFLNAEALTK